MFRHILFPTDGSPMSHRAAKMAIDLAKTCNAELTAVHVIPPFAPPAYVEGILPYPELYSPEEYKRVTEGAARAMLAKVEEQAKEAGLACRTAIVNASPVWKAVIDTARAKHCDAIVMASHGRKGIEGVLLGSETHRVLTHSKIPVLVCR
ncbi:MAG TPA: universal stress protein [Usitatibacter sp.]|nr:universal stress protein [Usitatibacter sp.]